MIFHSVGIEDIIRYVMITQIIAIILIYSFLFSSHIYPLFV